MRSGLLLLLLSFTACYNELKKINPSYIPPLDLNSGNVCTAPPKSVNACSGDSGGPLINNDTILIGVVSWGFVPCGNGRPDIYVNVGAYIEWITPHITEIYYPPNNSSKNGGNLFYTIALLVTIFYKQLFEM